MEAAPDTSIRQHILSGSFSAYAVKKSRLLAIMPLLAILGILAACGGGGGGLPGSISVTGRSLEIHAPKPQVVEKVAFLDSEGRHRLLRPIASNRQLAVVNVTIVNRTSTIIPLLIDPSAVKLGDRRTRRIEAMDIFEVAKVIDEADPEEGNFVPFLWGKVELERNTQVGGWMVFDVPKGLKLQSLWWNEVDDIIGDFFSYYQ